MTETETNITFNRMDRRKFLNLIPRAAGATIAAGYLGSGLSSCGKAAEAAAGQPARFYKKKGSDAVQCQLCPWECVVSTNARGLCGTRINRNGEYFTLAYGNPCSLNNDPIEKKPFYHFLPGTTAFSIATGGCNFHCKFCQNWEIARAKPDQLRTYRATPAEIVASAQKAGSRSIAFTYSEPIVFYEYMYDTARLAKKQNIHGVVVSNGFINEEPLKALTEYVSAYKVDLKSYRDKYYQDICDGKLQPVLETLVRLKKAGTWSEIVYLVLPTLNDSDEEIKELSKWIRDNLGPDVPLHFSRFHPTYKITHLPPTPVSTLERAYAIARDHKINYVYVGNVPGHKYDNTFCPRCGELLIKRSGYFITLNNFKKGRCGKCGYQVAGVWE